MDKPERTYSPGKASDHFPRGFYGTMTDPTYHDTTHGSLPVQVAGYQLGSSSVPRPSYQIPSTSVHPPAGGFHHQLPSQLAPPPPQPAVGLLRPSAANQPPGLHTQPVSAPHNVPPALASQAQFPAQMSAWMPGAGGSTSDSLMSQSVQQQQQFQRLKVEDALSYLDQVKLQFSGHPQVYNDFLDIMKEFKSQSIDTPGVIKRVSCLFRGHPDLIVGFNTFLPPGYKIAVEANETISVEQPGQQAISLSMFTTSLPSHVPVKPAHLNNPPPPETLSTPQSTQHGATPGLQAGVSDAAVTGPPVEFNHAIQYVNKIKVCYQSQPEIYKSFLDILHKYQNEQKMLKEGTAFPSGYRPLTEVEVYALVTELFKDQPQLLAEFSQFLPDASGIAAESALARLRNDCSAVSVPSKPPAAPKAVRSSHQSRAQPQTAGSRNTSQPPVKKAKTSAKETAFQDAERATALGDLSFIERMRGELGERDYAEIVQRIEVYMKQLTSPSELLTKLEPIINRIPELRSCLLEFLRQRDETVPADNSTYSKPDVADKYASKATYMVDLSTCKEEAVSYRLLPKSYCQPVCSGRSELCNEVLNDMYALHASWPDDISSLGPHRKNQYEEHMYQCEDERYELDMVLEMNNMAKTALMSVMSRLKNLTCPDDVARFRLDDTLGGNSEVLMRAALSRLYGDKTSGIIEGLKCNPGAAVPIVLRRLVAKEKEWRTAQHNFHRIWREQNERYYLKSLDHQAAKFKQNDVKQIRSKTLLKEVETEMQERDKADPALATSAGLKVGICHDASILSDAASLIINHVRRQSALQPDDKSRVRHVLFSFIPDLLRLSMPLPPDLDKEGDEDSTAKTGPEGTAALTNGTDHMTNGTDSSDTGVAVGDAEKPAVVSENDDGPTRSLLFYGNDNWYYFLRLYMMLCDRLKYFSGIAAQLIEEEMHYRSLRTAAVSAALKLRNPNAVDVRDSYGYFLELVRNLLDGNTELSSFEDQLRDMFSIHAYVAFTIDKLIQNITRQLQYIVTKDLCWQLVTLYEKYKKSANSDAETATYEKEAEQLIADDRCFRVCVDTEKTVMMIEYKDLNSSSSSEEPDQTIAADPEPASEPPAVSEAAEPPPRKATFLSRNLRRAHAIRQKQIPDVADDDAVDPGTLPSCVQLLNVESGAASLYTCRALSTAKQKHEKISCRLMERFNRWHNGWRADHVSAEQGTEFTDWLLGHVDGLKPDVVTVSHVNEDRNRPPYRNFTKYNVVSKFPVVTDTAAPPSESE